MRLLYLLLDPADEAAAARAAGAHLADRKATFSRAVSPVLGRTADAEHVVSATVFGSELEALAW